MSYPQALSALYELQRFGMKPGLERIRRLLALCGHPEEAYLSLQIGGTNGKGSAATACAAILEAAGYRVGLYTSPHLLDFTERIRLGGREIEPSYIAEWVGRMRGALAKEEATFFEAVTALAFSYYRDGGAEVVVAEVGLGGRHDATTALHPLVGLVTEVDLDHTEQLGTTIEAIAREKAGIARPGVPLVTSAREGRARGILCEEAGRARASFAALGEAASVEVERVSLEGTIFRYRSAGREWTSLGTPLIGRHQAWNLGGALLALESCGPALKVDERAVRDGLRRTRVRGRFDVVDPGSPLVICDVAHNPSGARALAATLAELLPGRTVHCVLGCAADKDVDGICEALAPTVSRAILTRPDFRAHDRRVAAADLRDAGARWFRSVREIPRVAEAVGAARAGLDPAGLLLVTGSFYTVAEALVALGAASPWEAA